MSKTLLEIKYENLEKGYGVTAKDIADCIGENPYFDNRVTQVSSKRFEEIMNAYKKKSFKECKAEKAELLSVGGKVFKDTNDYYLANHYILELTIEALEKGSFKVTGEKSSWEKADQGYRDLMQYLVEIGSPHADTLMNIKVDEPRETITLDKFIDSKKDKVRDEFSSYRGEKYTADRFDRIFSQIKKAVKNQYDMFTKDEVSRLKKGEPLLSLTQKTNLLTKEINRKTEQQTEANEHIDDPFKEKAQYAHTLTQKHNYFHKK